uniref:Uncharacterized protein n=1 Tax=Leptocylindrus danicus TaxID=163516 RepID=A0A7S2KZ90_9STRA
MRTAAKAGRSDIAEIVWDHALSYTGRRRNNYMQWVPSVKSLKLLFAAYMQEAASSKSSTRKCELFEKVVSIYEDIELDDMNKGLTDINIEELHSKRNVMMMILTAAVSLEQLEKSRAHDGGSDSRRKLRRIASSLVQLPCLKTKAARSPFEENIVKTAEGWAEMLSSEIVAVDFELSYQGFD